MEIIIRFKNSVWKLNKAGLRKLGLLSWKKVDMETEHLFKAHLNIEKNKQIRSNDYSAWRSITDNRFPDSY